MGMGQWFRIGISVAGFLILSCMIWFGGPVLSLDGIRPLDPVYVRLVLVLIAGAAVAGVITYDILRRRKASAALSDAIAGSDAKESAGDGEILGQRMKDALATLRKSTGGKGDALYDLPWYVLIGPPGSGKTTALINSGLRFPLAGGATPQAIAGVGGTRYCDWWFTDDAVLIDTAGRYTTQDSDAQADKKSWFAFLDLLRTNRPKQPLNGVILCISLEDVMSASPAELQAHSDAIRKRLVELHERLKVDFPVYALFTKADLVAGFMEFFGHLNEEGRRAVWGATFQTDDKTRNCVAEVGTEIEPLIARLNAEMIDRLQEEPTPEAKVRMFGFPTQVAMLRQPIVDFLTRIFEPTRYHANAALRGFYFTSGTQQGTPIDQLIGALAKSFGAEDAGAARYSGTGRSFFLHDLIRKVVIGEAGWVSTNRAAVRRGFMLTAASYAALGLSAVGLTAAWWVSYGRNTDALAAGYQAVTQYRAIAGPLRDEAVVKDRDFGQVLPALQHLRNLPAGHVARAEDVPQSAKWGLNQWRRLHSAGDSAYQKGLERMLRPRVMYRLEEVIGDQIANPAAIYEPLSVYLMIGGKEPLDRDFVTGWVRRDLEQNLFPGAFNQRGRQNLEEHLKAMLDFNPPDEARAIPLNDFLVQEAQKSIGRMSVADRAFELIKAQARALARPDWTPKRKAGADAELVFSAAAGPGLDSVQVPYLFTYDGFHQAFLPAIPTVAQQVQKERRLLGEIGEQNALALQHEQLAPALMQRYGREFAAAWQQALGQIRIRSLVADRPRYLSLQAAAAATSPIGQLMESIRDETQLTRERPQAAKPQQAAAPPAGADAPTPQLGRIGGEQPGASIEAQFRTLHAMVEGDRGRRPVDELIKALSDIHQTLIRINDPAQSAEANATFRLQLQTLRATTTRFPAPFAGLLQNATNAFDNDATGTALARLQQQLSEQVSRACQQMTAGKYPFTRGSNQDIPIQDFQRLFATGGIIDRFFSTSLASMADTSKREWAWNPTNPVGRQLPPQLLRDFQRAAEIRDTFFQGANPSFSFAVSNLAMGDGVEASRLELNGGLLSAAKPAAPAAPASSGGFGSIFGSPPPPPPPPAPTNLPPPVTTFQWPGPTGLAKAAIKLEPDQPGRVSTLERFGPWAAFRLIEAGSATKTGETLSVRFSVGGRTVAYQINPVTPQNPFTLPALREFRCPSAS
jgi:type VI secretion system protein ImpL